MVMQWTEARTLRDFGQCTALWLEEKLPHMPTSHYCASVSSETQWLVPVLAVLNRSGKFLTTCSQPACLPGRRPYGGIKSHQRAAVMGFVPPVALEHLLLSLRRMRETFDIKVSIPGAKAGRDTQLVSQHNGNNAGHFGLVLSREEIAEQYGPVLLPGWDDHPGLHPDVIAALQRCYQVSIVDQLWGRNSQLWPRLRAMAS